MKFPQQKEGVLYLTEGGQETEIMYKFGHDLPEFAMFTLFEKPGAMDEVRGMYERYLEVAARNGFAALMGGLDYRASPDWGSKLGYSDGALKDIQLQCIEFLREVSSPFASQLTGVVISGIIGPRGDAYELNRTITASEAEDYHSVQMSNLAVAGVDIVSAMTFNNIDEAVGVSRAAKAAGLPLLLYFTMDVDGRLKSGMTLREAIEAVDTETGAARPEMYGINCSHPFEFMPALEPGDWFSRVRALRPNAAKMDKIGLCQLGHLEAGDWVELGIEMGKLAKAHEHIDIWGGCCGTWETHLEEISRQVKSARQ